MRVTSGRCYSDVVSPNIPAPSLFLLFLPPSLLLLERTTAILSTEYANASQNRLFVSTMGQKIDGNKSPIMGRLTTLDAMSASPNNSNNSTSTSTTVSSPKDGVVAK